MGVADSILDFVGGGGYQEASDIYSGLVDQAQGIPLPILKEYYPELYAQVAQYAPESESAQMLGPSAMEGISTDPRLRQAQMNALIKLQEVGDQGGLTATDKARLAQIQTQNDAALRGQTGAIQQNLATRGLSGGMSELVARNIAAQEGANRQAQQGLDVKAQAEQRALDAIMKSGQLGGQIGQQDFSQAAEIARAKDLIGQFNARNTQDVQSRNVGARNQAAQQQARTAQDIANQNVGTRNEAQMRNIGLPQQNFQNQLTKQGLISGAQLGRARNEVEMADRNRQLVGDLIGTGAKFFAG